MEFFTHTLRTYPELAIFLALAIGFWFGRLKFGSFSLGAVTSSLLAGLLIGQLDITIAPVVGSTFFAMFLFAVGYEVGPPLFHGIKSNGLPQIAFTIVVCAVALGTAYGVAMVLHYDAGLAAGLLAGGTTNSGALGVATDTIRHLGLGAEQTTSMLTLAAIAYAVTYPFGTAGSVWFLSSLAPKLMRVDLVAASKELEAKLGVTRSELGIFSAYRPITVRAYRPGSASVAGLRVKALEAQLGNHELFVVRVRKGKEAIYGEPDTTLDGVTALALAGPPNALLAVQGRLGPEVDDAELLDFPTQTLDVVVTNKAITGKTVSTLATMDLDGVRHGVFLRGVRRSGQDMPLRDSLEIQRGDVLTIRGAKRDVERVTTVVGFPDHPTDETDVSFMSLGIVIGGIVGAITIHVGGAPLSLSTGVGAMLGGLVCGYLRSVRPTFGRIPAPALWAFNNIGLNGFVAVVGIGAGPGLISGLQTHGMGLLLAGAVVSLFPLAVALVVGKYIFKFHPALLFAACAGARSSTASIGALQNAAQSSVPLLGYAVPYATSRILLALSGVAIVLLMK